MVFCRWQGFAGRLIGALPGSKGRQENNDNVKELVTELVISQPRRVGQPQLYSLRTATPLGDHYARPTQCSAAP